MGLNIREIIPKKEISISDLRGKLICVDAYNALYQFLTTIRQPDGTPLMDSQQRITSHLSGIFYRNTNLMSEGIKLVYVFDGKPPELKIKTHEKRKEVRDSAKEKYEEAKNEEDVESMRKYSSMSIRIDETILKESKELLQAMGIAVVEAPCEGEAQAAYMTNKKEVYASVSQDYDSLLFGAKKLIRNLTLSRKKKTFSGWVDISPEEIDLNELLKSLGINLEQLICIGILVGTDYNPKGIPRIGQKKALAIVREHKTPEKIFEFVKDKIEELDDELKFDWKEIFDLFRFHPVKDVQIVFPEIDEDEIRKILVEEHEFSEERVNKQLEKLQEVKKAKQQKNLEKWF